MFPETMDLARLSPETTERMLLPDLSSQMDYALTHRPDLVRADYTFKQADAAVNVASADMYPDIILSASATGDRVDDADFRNDDFGNTVALTINYNIFAGGLTRAQINEARANRMAAENMIANQRLEISSEVNKAMARLKASQEQLKLQRDNAKLVNKNRELVEKEYAAGQTSLVRLNEAQRNLVQAQGRLAFEKSLDLQLAVGLDKTLFRQIAVIPDLYPREAFPQRARSGETLESEVGVGLLEIVNLVQLVVASQRSLETRTQALPAVGAGVKPLQSQTVAQRTQLGVVAELTGLPFVAGLEKVLPTASSGGNAQGLKQITRIGFIPDSKRMFQVPAPKIQTALDLSARNIRPGKAGGD